MKYYYLLNGKIMASNEKMPLEKDYIYTDKLAWWTASLQPCEISESELDNVKNYLCHNTKFEDFNPHEQIEVTNIVRLEEIKTITKSGTITDHQLFFKQPKQVEEIEAVEFAAYLSVNNWESSNGIMYNKFRIEYGSKYIVTTEHIKQLYEIFKNQK